MSVYVPPSTSGTSGCIGSCNTLHDQEYQYLRSYFTAHMLSTPSHRYAYIMWFVIAGSVLFFSALHHLGIGDKTWLGAYWTKFAPKTRVLKLGKTSGPPLTRGPSMFGQRQTLVRDFDASHSYPPKAANSLPPMTRPFVYTFPSFGSVLLAAAMVAVPLSLSFIGADYIRPSAAMFDISASWPNASDARYGYWGKRTVTAVGLSKRLQWGLGSFSPISTTAASYSIPYHTWWTIGGRFGLMTNALTPFITVLALKQVPWALLSSRVLGSHSFEKLSFLHKWGGCLLILFAVVHTVTWSIQLSVDVQFGTSMWGFVFIWTRFRWAFVAVFFLVLLALLSIGPIRKSHYEFFYVSHIICAIGFMVATALHHPPLAGWMWATLTWWGAERVTRAIKVAWVNGIGFAGRNPQQVFASSVTPNSSRMAHRSSSVVHDGQSFHGIPTSLGMNAEKIQQHFENGSEPNEPSLNGTRGYIRHTARTSTSSATLHDHGAWSPALKVQRCRTANSNESASHIAKPAFLEQDTLQPRKSRQFDDEWELDENGDKIRRRPSQRYGPVSEVLKEYGAGPHTIMSGIDEDSAEPTASQSSSSTTQSDPDCPQAHQDIGFAKPNGYDDAVWDRNAPHSSYDTQRTSSAEHYTSNSTAYGRHVPPYQQSPNYSRTSSRFMASPALASRQPRPVLPANVAALTKPGYAFAQILPGKTLRLTLRTPNRISWYPGQWVYLNTPAVHAWQSHPFTIACAYDASLPIVATQGDRDLEKGLKKERQMKAEERTVVLLLRVRKGFTLRLWDYVRRHRRLQVMAAAEAAEQRVGQMAVESLTTTGVHIRAIIDGAYGSTQRVRWGIHSSIVIVCGGSGVSFGISLLEHLCSCMTQRNLYGISKQGGENFRVQRVRFIWILREFAHLQWISSALRRCIELVPPEQLRIDLHVTHFNNQAAWQGIPGSHGVGDLCGTSSYEMLSSGSHPNTADACQTDLIGWKDAHGNVKQTEDAGATTHRLMEGPEADDLEIGANDLTEFDGEDVAGPSAAEQAINSRIWREGKLRRAHTRKVTLKRKGRREDRRGLDAEAGRDNINESQSVLAQRAMYEGQAPAHIQQPVSPQCPAPLNVRGVGSDHRNLLPSDALRVPMMPTSSSCLGTFGISKPGSPSLEPQSIDGHANWPSSMFMDVTARSDGRRSWSQLGDYTSPVSVPAIDGTRTGAITPLHRRQATFGSNLMACQSNTRLLPDAAAVAAAADEVVDFVDCPIDLDQEEDLDLRIIAELAQHGHPRLDRIIAEEVRNAQGRIMVASCGTSGLTTLLRRIVAKHIDPAKARMGDESGHINLCMESFEWGDS